MGTRADFYVGRGPSAEWLGSIAQDGYPDGWPGDAEYGPILDARDDETYRACVADMLAACDSATVPSQGWPWPWANSRLTDYSYAFDEGRVWVSPFGHGWHAANEGQRDDADELPKVEFPDMTKQQRVTMGRRSGIIVVGPHGPVTGED